MSSGKNFKKKKEKDQWLHEKCFKMWGKCDQNELPLIWSDPIWEAWDTARNYLHLMGWKRPCILIDLSVIENKIKIILGRWKLQRIFIYLTFIWTTEHKNISKSHLSIQFTYTKQKAWMYLIISNIQVGK